jgi:hypothetical protein
MFFYMLQILVFGLLLFLISPVDRHVEAGEITIVHHVCNLLLLKEHNPMYRLGKRLQQASFFDTQRNLRPRLPSADLVCTARHPLPEIMQLSCHHREVLEE